ncbi:MAG: hypothetical protein A2X96_00480 [Syntrophobacterales bacterium GWC2_56_13]|nr:MAG: hypothetical protein A2X96_00480 [Syntrophobacterales bacterium GWC2_56_13]
MAKERILVTVKTYPTLSRKYGETVCTAGVHEDGSWVRLYPVPFRRLNETEQYQKFDWLECELIKNPGDPRPESYRPTDPKQLIAVDHMDTKGNWRERRRLLLQTAKVFTCLQPLIDGAKANFLSLAVFKPTRILDFIWEEEEREWDPSKVAQLRNRSRQGVLFEEDAWQQLFRLILKLPYSFSYRFVDAEGKESEMQILDWEAGQLYWNCMKRYGDNEAVALAKVKEKYFTYFLKKDLHFFLGTTQQFHAWAATPWVVIGVFPIPHEHQTALF